MSINSIYADLFAKVTESAAISASKFRGKNDKISADQAAVDAMRVELNLIKKAWSSYATIDLQGAGVKKIIAHGTRNCDSKVIEED